MRTRLRRRWALVERAPPCMLVVGIVASVLLTFVWGGVERLHWVVWGAWRCGTSVRMMAACMRTSVIVRIS